MSITDDYFDAKAFIEESKEGGHKPYALESLDNLIGYINKLEAFNCELKNQNDALQKVIVLKSNIKITERSDVDRYIHLEVKGDEDA